MPTKTTSVPYGTASPFAKRGVAMPDPGSVKAAPVAAKIPASDASTFSFPLALTAFVLLFVLAQSRVDRMDPRLRAGHDDTRGEVGFVDEELL